MSEEYNFNPYHNQSTNLANIAVTQTMLDHLKATKPWVRFMSILMFICTAFMFIAGLLLMISFSMPAGMSGAAFGPIIGIIYWVMGLLYIAPGIFLFKFASSIDDLLKGGGDVALEMALGSQKSFWRFTGIVSLVVICLYGLFFLIAIISAASMFAR